MKTQQILDIMKFLFWAIFIGLLIKAGAMIFTFGMAFVHPEGASNLYLGLDLSELRTSSKWEFIHVGSLLVFTLGLQAYIAYLVIKITTTGTLHKPFTQETAVLLSKISHTALGVGIISFIAQGYCERLVKNGIDIPLTWGAKEFLFLAGVIFIISKVFQRGVEMQTENELTI